MKNFIVRNYFWLNFILLFIIAISAFILLLFAGIRPSNATTITILVGFIYLWITSTFRKMHMRKVTDLLFDKCDPKRFLTETDLLLKGEKNRLTKLNFLNWKIAGLIADYSFDEAEEIQKSTETLFDEQAFSKRIPVSLKITFAVNFVNLALQTNEISEAEKWLKTASDLTKSAYLSKYERVRLTKSMNLAECAYKLKLNKTDGCEDMLKGVIDFETRKSNKVYAHFLLGKLFLLQSRKEDAEKEFDFVIENGNRMAVVGDAQDFIAT